MRRLLCTLLLASSTVGAIANDELVPRARAILDEWHNAEPVKKKVRHLHLVYWTPQDREPHPGHRARLGRIMNHIRDFYASEMERMGFGRRTIGLAHDESGELVIHEVKGRKKFRAYRKKDAAAIRAECLPVLKAAGINADRETILIFTSLSEWDPENLTFYHRSPYYGSGSHRRGTVWQVDSPHLDITNLAAKEPLIKDADYGQISLGKHNSIFIGGIAQQLGHALGLPRNMATAEQARKRGTALMGAGNRTYFDQVRREGKGSFLTLASALRLASHPQFTGSIKGMNAPTTSALPELSLKPEGMDIRVRGRVECDPPAYAIVAYADPNGGGDYNAVTSAAVPDGEGRFSLVCEAGTPGKLGELRLFVLHVNGAVSGHMSHTPFRYPYFVDKHGQANLDTYRAVEVLQPLVAAVRERKEGMARDEAGRILAQPIVNGFDLPHRIATRILESLTPPAIDPAAVEPQTISIAVSELKPVTARVGWSKLMYNAVPDNNVLLRCGLQLYEHGIYAHAPAEHTYALGGQWERLRGRAGLADDHGGTVKFQIKGDQQLLWESKTLQEGRSVAFNVPLHGVQTLTLITDPTEDGKGGDWGVWLEPVLLRSKADEAP